MCLSCVEQALSLPNVGDHFVGKLDGLARASNKYLVFKLTAITRPDKSSAIKLTARRVYT